MADGMELNNCLRVEGAREKLFYPGYDNSRCYRIPSILALQSGTVIAAADKRNQHPLDWGDIDTMIRRKERGDQEFRSGQVILDLPGSREGENTSAFAIDSCLLQDRQTGRVFLLIDVFPESSGAFGRLEAGCGYQKKLGQEELILYDAMGKPYTVRRGGTVYHADGTQSCYRLRQNPESPFRTKGDLYEDGEYRGNIYLMTGPERGALHVRMTNFLWLLYSDDDGITWSEPRDITPMVKADWMTFLGSAPGTGIQLADGKLVFPVYSMNANSFDSQCSYVVISEDHGETWRLGGSPITALGEDPSVKNGGGLLTEAQLIQTAAGELMIFMRNTFSGYLYTAVSRDGGDTWENCKEEPEISECYCQLSVLNFQKDDREYILLINPSKQGRMDGRIAVGRILEGGTIVWQKKWLLAEGHFQYSSIAQNEMGNFEILYELDDESGNIVIWHTELAEGSVLGEE